MIDTPEPEFPAEIHITETTNTGTSKYLPLALYMLAMSGADAVAIVVVNGKFGSGGTGAAIDVTALAQLPLLLRRVADVQEREVAAHRGTVPPKPEDDRPDDVPR